LENQLAILSQLHVPDNLASNSQQIDNWYFDGQQQIMHPAQNRLQLHQF